MKIIQRHDIKWTKVRERVFQWRGGRNGHGFSFKVNENDEVDEASLNPAARENYRKCLDGTHDVIDLGIEEREYKSVIPCIGKCKCGAEVYLESFTNTCHKCNRDYNMSGQELAPRQFWGEETGEHYLDIVNFNPDSYNDDEW